VPDVLLAKAHEIVHAEAEREKTRRRHKTRGHGSTMQSRT
jgi:hypothetical protein